MRLPQHWARFLLAPVVLGAATMFTVASFTPKRYKTEAIIQVVPQQVPTAFVRSVVTQRLQDRINSIAATVQSRTRLERIITERNLYPEQRAVSMEHAVDHMRRSIGMAVQGDTFTVSFSHEEPKTAAELANRVASAYIDESLRDRERLAQGTRQFLDGQIEEVRQRLIATSEREKKGIAPAEAWAFSLEKDALAAQFKSLASRSEDAKLSAELERRQIGEQFRILEQARVPLQPFAPNRQGMTVGGALIGFGLGLVALLIAALRRP